MEWLASPEAWIALLTLTILEVVLGIDNIIFISILSGKVPKEQQARARNLGMILAIIPRVLLLFVIAWIIGLTAPLFNIFGQEISGRDLILLAGGLFLLANATREIHHKLEGEEDVSSGGASSMGSVLAQMMILNLVFSLDGVITAVGMADILAVMVIAILAAGVVMIVLAGPISSFVQRHPTVKMLALSFLILIGVSLVAESFDQHIPKGYIYFSMGFAVLVEMLNLQIRGSRKPVQLHGPLETQARAAGESGD